MGLHEYYAMLEQWRRHPPTHWLLAAFLGVKPPQEDCEPVPEENTRDDLLSWFGEING